MFWENKQNTTSQGICYITIIINKKHRCMNMSWFENLDVGLWRFCLLFSFMGTTALEWRADRAVKPSQIIIITAEILQINPLMTRSLNSHFWLFSSSFDHNFPMMCFYKEVGLNVPVIRSTVQLSFWTLCLCGSQESAIPSFPGSSHWMLNSLHASYT